MNTVEKIQKRVFTTVLIELTVKFMEPMVTLLQVCSSKAGQLPLTTKLLRKRSTIFVCNKTLYISPIYISSLPFPDPHHKNMSILFCFDIKISYS